MLRTLVEEDRKCVHVPPAPCRQEAPLIVDLLMGCGAFKAYCLSQR